MSITFECMACGADYDLEIPAIIERPNSLKCPNCGAHPPAHRSHALATALEDLLAAMAAVRKKIRFEIELETDELPPPYGPLEEEETGLDFENGEEGAEGAEEEEEEEEEEEAEATPARRGAKTPVKAAAGKGEEEAEEEDDFDDLDEEADDDDDLDDDEEDDDDDDDDEDEEEDDDDDEDEDDDEEEEEEEEEEKPKPARKKK